MDRADRADKNRVKVEKLNKLGTITKNLDTIAKNLGIVLEDSSRVVEDPSLKDDLQAKRQRIVR